MNALRTQKSLVGRSLFYLGCAVIVLSVAGFLISIGEYSDYGLESELITSLMMSVIAGFILFAFSEIIMLLGEILRSSRITHEGREIAPDDLPSL